MSEKRTRKAVESWPGLRRKIDQVLFRAKPHGGLRTNIKKWYSWILVVGRGQTGIGKFPNKKRFLHRTWSLSQELSFMHSFTEAYYTEYADARTSYSRVSTTEFTGSSCSTELTLHILTSLPWHKRNYNFCTGYEHRFGKQIVHSDLMCQFFKKC